MEMVASGFLGGVISGVVCAPMERVMIQQQRSGGSLFATPAHILRQTGTAGLFRGLWTSCAREGIFTAGYLGVGPALKRYFVREGHEESHAKIASAVIAGVASATISHPIDTIKTCMQVGRAVFMLLPSWPGIVLRYLLLCNDGSGAQGDLKGEVYKGNLAAVRLVASQGMAAFFRGWGWRSGRTICTVFIINEASAAFEKLLFAPPPA
jgi:hypothetical protein